VRSVVSRTIAIRPHVGVFALFSAVDYKAWYALAEFVDNSVQSFLDRKAELDEADGHPARLTVIIDPSASAGQSIRVWDNAGGIATERLDAAFQVATPPPDSSGLSVYGIGMKSAAAWFGDRFEVSTKAVGESLVRHVCMDFPSIVENRLERVEVAEEPASAREHYTELVLSHLHHPIQTSTHEKIRRHLASIYRSYIRSDLLTIVYDGEPLAYSDPEVLVAPYFSTPTAEPVEWRKEINITLETGERLSGFAALRRTADTKSPGFALFRRDRVITGIEDDPWRPLEIFGQPNKFPAQRLFGELHLDNVKVSYSKNGFVWQAAEEELITALRQQLDAEPLPLLRQAHGHRARVAEKAERDAASRALDRTADAIAANVAAVISESLESPPAPAPTALLDDVPVVSERSVELDVNGVRWTILADLVNGEPYEDWLEIAADSVEDRRIQIRVSLAHPFSRRFAATDADDLEAMIRIAASLALAIVVADMQGAVSSLLVLANFNELLDRALSGT
jgi:hypothetical protein